MNREILFRGFHPCENGKDRVFINGEWINGKWIEGNHLYDEITDKHYIVPFGNINESQKVGQEGCCYCVGFEVIPETVGQYTGLTDKNDKKIFKGDIVNYIYYGSAIKGIIKFGEYKTPYEKGHVGFYINWDLTKQLASFFKENASRIEVIGNIHDNPELMEVTE